MFQFDTVFSASVTAYECVLSVVKYCGVTEGPLPIEGLTQFSVVRTACGAFLPVTTTASPVNIGPIGDLFPKSFFSSSTQPGYRCQRCPERQLLSTTPWCCFVCGRLCSLVVCPFTVNKTNVL